MAQRLVYTTGFEQMSIQDILDELKISKGAFYHYFDSKLALLDELVERMMDEAEQVLQPIVEASDLPAIEKLQRYFAAGSRWKVSRKSFMLDLLRVWYTDSNSLVRQKQEAAAMKRIAPMLAKIVRQGIAEGVFTTTYPDQIGSMIWGLAEGIVDQCRRTAAQRRTTRGCVAAPGGHRRSLFRGNGTDPGRSGWFPAAGGCCDAERVDG